MLIFGLVRHALNVTGTYTVAYTPEIGGDYYISVKHSGIDIQGSPFTVASDPMPREGLCVLVCALWCSQAFSNALGLI